jgi:hypothetical protein
MCADRWQEHSPRKYFDIKGRKQREAEAKLHCGNFKVCTLQPNVTLVRDRLLLHAMRDMMQAQRNFVGKTVIEFRFKTRQTDI